MADVIAAVTVDLAYALHAMCKEINARIRAAEHLPSTAKRCSRLINQIDNMIDGCSLEDRRIAVILENIHSCMEELETLVDRLVKIGASSGGSVCICLTLAGKGKDALTAEDDMDRCESELRKHLESLVQATQLHTYSSRASNKLKQVDSRRFWDEHFGDQREVSLTALAQALRFECGDDEDGGGVDMDTATGICKTCFSGSDVVTVLSFGEVFNQASIPETMKSLAKRANAASHLFKVTVYDYEARKPDRSLDAGFLMCRDTDSLKVLRSQVVTHALTLGEEESSDDDSDFDYDDEPEKKAPKPEKPRRRRQSALDAVPPEYQFLAYGDFTFFLDECETRVRRKQERDLAGLSYIDRVSIVRDDDLPDSLKPKKKGSSKARANADSAWEKSSQGTSIGDEDEDMDQGTGSEDIAEAIMRKAAEAAAAAACKDIATAIRTASVLMGLRIAAKKCRIPEESVSFLVEIDQLRQAAEAIAPTSAGAVSMPRLRLVKASATNIAERFLSEETQYKLPVSKESAAAAYKTIQRTATLVDDPDPLPGLDHGMLEALRGPFDEVEAALAPALAVLKEKNSSVNHVMRSKPSSDAPKHRVVILGGGFAGAMTVFNLCNDPEERFHVTLIDPKNYWEDPTQQPMALPDPGESVTQGRLANATVPFSKIINKNGKHIAGLAMSISKTHVEVGSERTVVPFDTLVVNTGSAYNSCIKVVNPTLDYRFRQMKAEANVIKNSETILVIGGGLVGTEIVSNVATKYPEKKVLICQAGPYILPRVPEAHDKVTAFWESLGNVEVHLNERVIEFDDMLQEYKTDKGNTFHAGKVIRATGYKPNTDFFKDANTDPAIAAALDAKGFVKCDPNLRLHGLSNIYVSGDIVEDAYFGKTGVTRSGERFPERLAAVAGSHSYVVTHNIKRTITGETLASMDASRDPFGQPVEISLGLEKGLAVVHGDLAPLYVGMGFDFGVDNEEFVKYGCAITPNCPGLKDYISDLCAKATYIPEAHEGLRQFGAMDPKILDPLAPPMPPPPGAEGAGGGEADQAPADPAPEPTEEAKADEPEAAFTEAEE